ncbi:endonuclease III domain-containing protein [Geobacter sp. FeAm09]|uniref:endonuclease III domain-containing protein n=1 Tax=Geobacter sp. FeAm09 TaxID=2597769 RepID=UPI0011EC77EC|nr:endonuclease III domain-containing protein [Geobacter sp. FeAm09]QEM66846.1 endonuclease III domain-containing protein [Geobacter sp. FeAm09]
MKALTTASLSPTGERLKTVFLHLLERFGPRFWWPAETPFEVCIGAILTQNTAWTNVEKAISALKGADVLTMEGIEALEAGRLAELIRPAGYYNVKSARIKEFVGWLRERHGGSLDVLFSGAWREVRRELLKVRGIGPETCDAILLYAGNKPTFVVDAYTRRLFHRLGLVPADAGYDETRLLFMTHLPGDVPLFNEYHALIVEQCKVFCRARPLCTGCPLAPQCPTSRSGGHT